MYVGLPLPMCSKKDQRLTEPPFLCASLGSKHSHFDSDSLVYVALEPTEITKNCSDSQTWKIPIA